MRLDTFSRELLAFAAAAVFFASNISTTVGDIVSEFDSDLDGWTLLDPVGGPDISWQSTGGNPNGYLRFDDMSNGFGLAVAPSKFLGEWSYLDGIGRLEFDQTLIATGENIAAIHRNAVRINGPGGTASWFGTRPTGTTPWESFVIPISEANWNVSSGDWNGLLADVTEFVILVELVEQTNNNGLRDSSGLDNVRLAVPEPQMGLLLTACFVCVIGFYRHRRRSCLVTQGCHAA